MNNFKISVMIGSYRCFLEAEPLANAMKKPGWMREKDFQEQLRFCLEDRWLRECELAEALKKNLEDPRIEDVHVFIEDPWAPYERRLQSDRNGAFPLLRSLLKHPKATVIRHGKRPTYQDYFQHANCHFKGRVVALLNSDVHFDETLQILSDVDFENLFICLAREHNLSRFGGQDAWIFKAPVREISSNWTLGMRGGDRKIAFEARKAGYKLANPGFSLVLHHLHSSSVRVWNISSRMGGSLIEVPPHAADSLPRKAV